VKSLLEASPRLLTLEEHLVQAGFGSAVLEAVHANGFRADGVKAHGVPDTFVEHSPQSLQRALYKVDVPGVVQTVLELYPDLGRQPAKTDAEAAAGGDAAHKETVHWT
jgi:1-deoxy-D-xylulose-5-phosphate synthase